MNLIFFFIIAIAYASAFYHQWHWTAESAKAVSAPMQLLTNSLFSSASDAVTLSIGLIGVMAFLLGLMKVAEKAGLLDILAKCLQPLLTRLFPDVPPHHPAMGAMVMNISANLLGLGNAATPFGVKAMQYLGQLNPHPHVASNAMVLFLAINTSSVTLLPTKVIALRAAAGSLDPAGIIATTLFATLCSTTIAIFSAKYFQRFYKLPKGGKALTSHHLELTNTDSYPLWISICALSTLLALVPIALLYGKALSPWIVPTLLLGILSFGLAKGVSIYETFTDGAKEGFEVAIKIIPYLVAILVAIGMLRESGALGLMVDTLAPFTSKIGLPAEALPMALIRPLSGSGALGIMASTLQDPNIGPDSYVGYLVSTIMGSTETTFYVIAVYFGAIQIKKLRHAVIAALLADLTGILAAAYIVKRMFG